MLMFLAGVLEQMDLALEHVSKRGVHDARFGLMLTDNAVELVLHQIAKDQNTRIRNFRHMEEEYPHKAELEAALRRSFDDKVRFARVEGHLTEEVARSIVILHSYRNEVYHIGLQHEDILPGLAKFYFATGCEFLAGYKPPGLGWGSGMVLPDRAKKYFSNVDDWMPGGFDDFPNACRTLQSRCSYKSKELIASLVEHMNRVVGDCDLCISIVADGIYDKDRTTREKAILHTQSWSLAFAEEGLAFAWENGFSGNRLRLVEWLAQNFPFKVKADPIPSWKKQMTRLRSKNNAHAALATYQSFMTVTAPFREMMGESAAAVEAEIGRLIDERRRK